MTNSFVSLINLSLLIIFFAFANLVDASGLVHFVLLDKVGHVRASLIELDSLETLVDVPVDESTPGVHLLELAIDTGEELTEGGGVTDEGSSHLETTWWDVADGGLDVGWDPLDEVASVPSLDVEHLLVDLFRGHAATEVGGDGEVDTPPWVASGHHVLVVEELAGELWDGKSTVLLAATGSEWSEAADEEVETWEWDKVDSQLPEVRVELTWEAEGAGGAAHDHGDEVVEVAIGWGGELEGPEADIVESLVIDAEDLISGLDELVDGEGAVVWLDDGVRNLWRWDDGVGGEDTIWVLFTELVEEEGTKTRAGTTTEGVDELEALESIAGLGLLTDDIEDGLSEFLTFGVVTLGPVVASAALAEDEVVWAEELTVLAGTDGVHGTWLKVDEDSTWDVLAAGGLVVVDVDALELEIAVAVVAAGWVNAVLVGDDLPELSADLVAALASLDVNDFANHHKE